MTPPEPCETPADTPLMMQRQNTDGSYSPAAPLGWQGGPYVEVSREGRRYRWCIYDEDVLVATGIARTRLGLVIAVCRFHRKANRS